MTELIDQDELINDILTIDFNGNKKNKVNDFGVLTLGNSTPIVPWKSDHYRASWDTIPIGHVKGMNLSININMDNTLDWYANTKKIQIPAILLCFEKIKLEGIINKYVLVYEWGKYGKKDGKLHYHGLVKTKKKDEFINSVNKEFNKRKQCSHRTLRCNWIKDLEHRQRYLNYMRKESQNKIKCLMWD